MPWLRNCLTLIIHRNSKNIQIVRKGLHNISEFNENLFEINENDKKSKRVFKKILKPCSQSLSEGKIN